MCALPATKWSLNMLTLKSPNSTVSTVIKEGDQVKENGLVETPRPSEVTVLKAGYVKKLKVNKSAAWAAITYVHKSWSMLYFF